MLSPAARAFFSSHAIALLWAELPRTRGPKLLNFAVILRSCALLVKRAGFTTLGHDAPAAAAGPDDVSPSSPRLRRPPRARREVPSRTRPVRL